MWIYLKAWRGTQGSRHKGLPVTGFWPILRPCCVPTLGFSETIHENDVTWQMPIFKNKLSVPAIGRKKGLHLESQGSG